MGRLNEAARQNRIGTRIAPEFVPPTVGLAEVHIARGRLGRATKIVGRAAAALPSIEYLATLAELYDATGREQLAKSSYAAVDEKIQDYRAAGVLPDVDFILFYADRKLHLDKTLAEARAMYEVRPTAAVSDALAWTLHALGRDEEALPFALDAAGVAPQDPLIDLHAAVIADALGKSKTATTLATGAAKLAWTLPPTRVAELHRLLAQMATTRS
jgi:tetratricopeptide (TPR) repeat protein